MAKIPKLSEIQKIDDPRVSFLLSFTGALTVTLSILYTILLLIGKVIDPNHTSLPLILGFVFSGLFILSQFFNKIYWYKLSLFLTVLGIVSICFISGLTWGFDMPSVILGFVMATVLVSTTASKKVSIYYILGFLTTILVGHNIRDYLEITNTWHNMLLQWDDIVEFAIILFYIMSLLFFSNREQQKLLSRSIRSEKFLQDERDQLHLAVESRTLEIKKLQMDKVSHMYRFVEFGRMAGGLFHDLITPIQTLKLQIESSEHRSAQGELAQIKKTADRLESMMNTLRKQIRFDTQLSDVDALNEIREIIYITKYLHIKNNITVELVSSFKSHIIRTNKAIFNHVVQNLLSNACEACIAVRNREAIVSIHVGTQDSKTFIAIVDNGKGIANDNINKIFEPFYSSKGSNNCGIGLSSTKHAVEKHLGGKIFCESEEDIGTTMTIIL